MAKLIWDVALERKFEMGVSKGTLAVIAPDGTQGPSVVWNGLKKVAESPEGGEATKMEADNIVYAEIYSAEKMKGSIEAYMYPQEFEPCLGYKSVGQGAVLGQQEKHRFNFSYESLVGNAATGTSAGHRKIHIIWNAMASPMSKEYNTIGTENAEGVTFSISFDALAIPVAGNKPAATITIDTQLASPIAVTKIEEALYGSATKEPKFPTPAEVIAMITGV